MSETQVLEREADHDEIAAVVKSMREDYRSDAPPSARERIDTLKRMEAWITDHREDIQQAIYRDFKKPSAEVDLSEVYVTLNEIRFTRKHLREWMAARTVSAPLAMIATHSEVRYEPKGVVLVIAPWNFPFMLTMAPVVSALAAGNRVVIKPSELTPHTSQLMQEMVDELFEPNQVSLFQGGKEVSQELLDQPFDHIFFTGSPRVGKIVMKAAAEHLTSVTLELGGKSPAIVDNTANLADTADKIVWGKFVNAGQTCIAPDYILVDHEVKEELLSELQRAVSEAYDSELKGNQTDNYASIVNENHFERLSGLITQSVEAGAELVCGGTKNSDPSQRFLPPTILDGVTGEMPVMQEEIFGPILPVLTYDSLDDAIRFVNDRPNPLAFYTFTTTQRNEEYLFERTSAGGNCVNETLLQFMHKELPFGGAGFSGIGKGHGKHGFMAFSNERPVLQSPTKLSPTKLFYPPYTPKVKKMIDLLIRYL